MVEEIRQKEEARSVFLQKLSPIEYVLAAKAFPNSSRDSRTLLSVHVGNNNGVPASIVFRRSPIQHTIFLPLQQMTAKQHEMAPADAKKGDV